MALVESPTRGQNILLTNRPSLIVSCKSIDGISDQEAVLVKSDTIVHLTDPPARSVYLWSPTDFDNIRQTIQGYCEEFVAACSLSL